MKYLKSLTAGVALMAILSAAALAGGSDDPKTTDPATVEVAANADDTLDPADTAGSSDSTPTTSTTEVPVAEPGADDPVALGPVYEVIPGEGAPAQPEGPADPIGGFEDLVPEGLDLTLFPGAPAGGASPVASGPTDFTAGPGCHNNCITKGVAYPRGFGAELVVETNVPARIFMTVVADTTGDGDYDFDDLSQSFGKVSDFTWVLDHLDPGQTYYVMAAATDEHDNTAYVYGEFTTLSE